ncbi:queuine tRNA-ribosyltransferase [Microbacterium phage Megan]|uniref:Queuine tRNA-ribosyltransferase n=1 Tax=Microbacterium phage Megan TaxID=2656551 RepID=A0A649VKF2_9CAUD|nr:queuine tRNA-ribosyltransferase [Microbacterium phage Megan]QGJ92674.1 queuine tRNA-ribosyltransferase [Microbacterium phage Megan]
MNPHHGLTGDSRVGVLLSYWAFKQKRDLASDMGTTAPICIDSGAFSAYTSGAKIEVAEYAEWLDAINRPIDYAFNLDVLGDEEASYRNWRALRDEHGHLTMPVIHFGQRPEEALPPYLAVGIDRLSMGGIAGGATKQSIGWSAHVFRWLRANGLSDLPVHGLGLHMRSDLARLPWATTDSSTYVNLWRFGHFVLWTGKAWPMVWLDARDGKGVYAYGDAFRRMGVEPADVDRPRFRTDDPLACEVIVRIEDTAARDFASMRRLEHTPRRYLAANVSNYGLLARGIDRLYSDQSTVHPSDGGNSGV